MNRVVRKALRRFFLEEVEAKSHGSTTDDNAKIRACLDKCWRDGAIGVRLSGMDCDCTQYYREYVLTCPNSVQWFKRHWDRHCEWLDGPESQSFCLPSEIVPQHRSYDLAMEAYENGHTSTVYIKPISELVERN